MIITVENELQKILLEEYLIDEIQFGFWSDKPPSTHTQDWVGVQVSITEDGKVGVSEPLSRRYNFMSADFISEHFQEITEAVKTEYKPTSSAEIRKALKAIGDICGGRLTCSETGTVVTKREIMEDLIPFKTNFVFPVESEPILFENYQYQIKDYKILPVGFFDDFLFSQTKDKYLTLDEIHETV